MKHFLRTASVFLFVVVLMHAGTSYGQSEVQALKDAKGPAERARIQALINGAKSEKKLQWVANTIEPKMAIYIAEGFKAYYGLSNFSCEFTFETSARIVTRIEQLVKAKRPTPDIIWYAAWAWYKDLLSRDLIMRYDSPMYKEYTISNKLGTSVEGYWVSDLYTFHPLWNPAAVEKAGIKIFNPTSWWDFTDPKIAKYTSIGAISRSQTYSGVALGLRKVLGDEWFKKVANLKPGLYLKQGQARDWIASNEYSIALFSYAKTAEQLKKMGVKVKLLYPKEGVVMIPFAPAILSSAPQPNAAKLFIDYVRSKPGTDRVADSKVCIFHGRPGVKTPLKEFLPPAEEVKMIPIDWDKEGTIQAMQELQKWVIKIGL